GQAFRAGPIERPPLKIQGQTIEFVSSSRYRELIHPSTRRCKRLRAIQKIIAERLPGTDLLSGTHPSPRRSDAQQTDPMVAGEEYRDEQSPTIAARRVLGGYGHAGWSGSGHTGTSARLLCPGGEIDPRGQGAVQARLGLPWRTRRRSA